MSRWIKERDDLERIGFGGRYGKVMVPLEEAREILLSKVRALESERVSLIEAMGRVLAQPVIAEEPVPSFDRSPLDGYAVRTSDVAGASQEHPVTLRVIEEVPAGYIATQPLVSGTAIKVLTGAPLPEGADGVIRYEETHFTPMEVTISRPMIPGEGIAPRGEEIQLGETVLSGGTVLGSPHIGLLASLGIRSVRVFRRPKVGLFSTGDELWDGAGELPPGKIRPTNLYTLAALIWEAGGEAVLLGTTRDRREDVAATFQKAVSAGVDMVLSTGGVSAGDYDVVKDAMADGGAENLFWKVALRPGAPVATAQLDGRLLIGLSGNPAGAIMIFLLLVAPVIAALGGKQWSLRRSTAFLAHPVQKRKGLRGFWWARVEQVDGRLAVTLLGEQKCGVMRSYLASNCLVELPAGSHDWSEGRETLVYWLPGKEWA